MVYVLNNYFLLIIGIIFLCAGLLITILAFIFREAPYSMFGIVFILCGLFFLWGHYEWQRSKEVFEQKCSQVTEAIESGEKDVYINGVPVPGDFDLDGISLSDYHIEIKKDKIYLTR